MSKKNLEIKVISKGMMSEIRGGDPPSGCCLCNPGQGETGDAGASDPPLPKAAYHDWDPMLCAP